MALVPLPAPSDRAAHRGGLVSGDAIRRELGLADDEPLPDAAAMPVKALATVARWSTPPGMFTDLAPVHLLTSRRSRPSGRRWWWGRAAPAALTVRTGLSRSTRTDRGACPPARFRPTVLVDLDEASSAYPERAWVGGRIRLGADAVLPVTMRRSGASSPPASSRAWTAGGR